MSVPPEVDDVDLEEVNLFDPNLYATGDPHAIWRALRLRDPVRWQQLDDGRGFWSITRYDHACRVLRDHDLFTSEGGNLLYTLGSWDPAAGKMMTSMDPPGHTELREPLNHLLSHRELVRREDHMRRAVRRFLLPLLDDSPWDLAEAGMSLPMSFTGPLLGVPESDWAALARTSVAAMAPDDPEFGVGGTEEAIAKAHFELFEYFSALVHDRGTELSDDLIGCLMGTEIDGRGLTHDEVVYNCYSLLLGANVTAPHVVATTVLALIEQPAVQDEIAARPELVPSAVEEALRWSSPANHFMRHAVDDVTLGDVRIHAGDPVVAWVGSANRDEEVFADPYTFDVARKPNRHLAFGFGRHYCVGAPIARIALGLVVSELVGLVERFELAGPVERMRSNFVAGVKHMPVVAHLRADAARVLRAETLEPE
ncbi:cytochrome P450 [Lentzea xinjiangensis]|nr:cytochrome P450 [Lentzea xinjiangensis]